MTQTVKKLTLVIFTVEDGPQMLSTISAKLRDEGINLKAWAGWSNLDGTETETLFACDADPYGVVLLPIPEPGLLCLMVLGFAALIKKKRINNVNI